MERREFFGVLGGAAAAALDAGVAWTREGSQKSDGELPFEMPSAHTGKAKKEVYAHWHVFPISTDNVDSANDYYSKEILNSVPGTRSAPDFGGYFLDRPLPRKARVGPDWEIADMVQDVRWAQRAGIDGFLFNIVGIGSENIHWRRIFHALVASKKAGGHFKIIPSLDATSDLRKSSNDQIVAALQSIASDPSIKRNADGRIVLGSFRPEAWTAERWADLFDKAGLANLKIAFFPVTLDANNIYPWEFKESTIVGHWSGNSIGSLSELTRLEVQARAAGKMWAASIWPQDCRPKRGIFWEAANSSLFRKGWESAIRSDADIALLTTWNDYTECSEIRPSVQIGHSFQDLCTYYAAWFKTGRPPAIKSDVLYYFHRVQHTDDFSSGYKQPRRYEKRGFGQSVNEIELVAFLAGPGELEIEIVDQRRRSQSDGGMARMTIPIRIGRPRFRLKRDRAVIIELESQYEIVEAAPYQDLMYRGGSSRSFVP